jgi:hypothetical protein
LEKKSSEGFDGETILDANGNELNMGSRVQDWDGTVEGTIVGYSGWDAGEDYYGNTISVSPSITVRWDSGSEDRLTCTVIGWDYVNGYSHLEVEDISALGLF